MNPVQENAGTTVGNKLCNDLFFGLLFSWFGRTSVLIEELFLGFLKLSELGFIDFRIAQVELPELPVNDGGDGQAGIPFIVGGDYEPRCVIGGCFGEDICVNFLISVPMGPFLQIGQGELPVF